MTVFAPVAPGLISTAAAIERIVAKVQPIRPRRMHVGQAEGCTLAGDVLAPFSVPDAPTALGNGWAVASASPAQTPLWIEAGEPLPATCDAVLDPDAHDPDSPDPGSPDPHHATRDANIALLRRVEAGDGVRPTGGEARKGDVLARAGDILSACAAAAAAGCGVVHVQVRQPRVRLFATGSWGELARADVTSPLIGMIMAGYGVETGASRRARDEPDQIATNIAAPGVDAVFVIGGSGVGSNDRSFEALESIGGIEVAGVAIAGAGTAIFGFAAPANGPERPVLVLPGRPDAALAAFLVLGRPLLAALAGTASASHPVAGVLTDAIKLDTSDTTVLFLRREGTQLHPLGGPGLPLALLARANAFAIVAPGTLNCSAGAPFAAFPL